MIISAFIGASEAEFEVFPPTSDETRWHIRKLKDEDGTIYGSFTESDSIIGDLVLDELIRTPKDIVLERLIEAFQKYNEARQMGFESENSDPPERRTSELNPYDPELIRVRPMVLSAYQVNMDINKKIVDLNPDFQRNFVWDDTRKSRLIESMLLKIPLPAFYFAEDRQGNYQVVDGLQRLTVINSFFKNGFRLKNLEYLKELEHKYYEPNEKKGIMEEDALNETYASRVQRTQLNINVIEASSPLRVKYDIFFRINTGGRPLNQQEIRNCFATEETRILLKRMASNHLFELATGNSIKDTRMDAQELSLRFLGFLFFRDSYAGDMNSFLDEVLEKLDGLKKSKIEEAEVSYYKALRCAYHLFGEYAFRKCLPEHLMPWSRRQLINKAMFIVWTIILAAVDEKVIFEKTEGGFVTILALKLKENIRLFNSLTTGTSDKNNLDYVFSEFRTLLNAYILQNETGF